MASTEYELSVLSDELGRLSEAESNALNAEIALVAAQVVVHAGVLAAIVQGWDTSSGEPLDLGFGWLLLPLVPYWITGFHMMLSTRSTLRGFYMRALERRIHNLSDASVALDETTSLVAPSYYHVLHTSFSSRTSNPEQKAVFIAGIIVMQGLMIAEAIYCVTQIDDVPGRLLGTLVYSFLAVLIFTYTWRISAGGPKFWKWTLRAMQPAWARDLGPKSIDSPSRQLPAPEAGDFSGELRSVSSAAYLLHPRPIMESINKSLLAMVIFAIGCLQPGNLATRDKAIWGLLLVLAFEHILYPARYYINDVLDQARQTAAIDRGMNRPQIGRDVSRLTVGILAALRFLVGGVFMLVIARAGSLAGGTQLVLTFIGVFVLASVAYEFTRWLFPAATRFSAAAIGKMALYLVTLSAGYAVRSFLALVTGLGAGADHTWGAVVFSAGAGLVGAATVVLNLADVALMIGQYRPDAVNKRKQGHTQLLALWDRGRHPWLVPGVARFRERSVPIDSMVFWLFLPTCPLLVLGTGLIIGETHSGSLALLAALALVGQLAYLLLRRYPSAIWPPLIATSVATVWSAATTTDYGYWQYLWVVSPIIATLTYFEFFRDSPPTSFVPFVAKKPQEPAASEIRKSSSANGDGDHAVHLAEDAYGTNKLVITEAEAESIGLGNMWRRLSGAMIRPSEDSSPVISASGPSNRARSCSVLRRKP